MIDVEHNRRIAVRMVERLSRGVIDDALVTADVHWWIPGLGLVDRPQFQKMVDDFNALKVGDGRMEIRGITAEGDRVAVEAESFMDLVNGRHYNNTYHFLFEFLDGRIRLAKEYNNSKLAADVLGAI